MPTEPGSNISLSDIRQFAASEEGKKLLAMLRNDSSGRVKKAAENAANGNLETAKHIIEEFLAESNSPKTRNRKEDANGK